MHGLVFAISLRQVFPRRAGAQNPKDAIEDLPAIGPRPAAPISPHAVGRQDATDNFPLLVRQIHP